MQKLNSLLMTSEDKIFPTMKKLKIIKNLIEIKYNEGEIPKELEIELDSLTEEVLQDGSGKNSVFINALLEMIMYGLSNKLNNKQNICEKVSIEINKFNKDINKYINNNYKNLKSLCDFNMVNKQLHYSDTKAFLLGVSLTDIRDEICTLDDEELIKDFCTLIKCEVLKENEVYALQHIINALTYLSETEQNSDFNYSDAIIQLINNLDLDKSRTTFPTLIYRLSFKILYTIMKNLDKINNIDKRRIIFMQFLIDCGEQHFDNKKGLVYNSRALATKMVNQCEFKNKKEIDMYFNFILEGIVVINVPDNMCEIEVVKSFYKNLYLSIMGKSILNPIRKIKIFRKCNNIKFNYE